MIFIPRLALVGMAGTVIIACAATAAAAEAYDRLTDTPAIMVGPTQNELPDLDNCAHLRAFQANGLEADAAIGPLSPYLNRFAETTGGKAGRVAGGTTYAVVTSDDTVFLFDHRGHRVAVGAHERDGAPMTWFEPLGLTRLYCRR